MKFLNKSGKLVNINVAKYKIDWDKVENKSKPQLIVERFLNPYWKSDYVLTEFRIPGSKMRIDLLNINKNIAIEISPLSSHSYNDFFHKGNRLNFLLSFKRDEYKQKWIEKNNFTYIKLSDNHLKNLSVELFAQEFNIIL